MGANFIPDSTKQKQTTTKPTPDTYCKNPTKVFLLFLSFLLFQLNVVMIFKEERKVKTRRKKDSNHEQMYFFFPFSIFGSFYWNIMAITKHLSQEIKEQETKQKHTKNERRRESVKKRKEMKRKTKVMNYDSSVISDYSFSAAARAFKTVFVSLFVSKSSLNCINS